MTDVFGDNNPYHPEHEAGETGSFGASGTSSGGKVGDQQTKNARISDVGSVIVSVRDSFGSLYRSMGEIISALWPGTSEGTSVEDTEPVVTEKSVT